MGKHSFVIDKITNSIEDAVTGMSYNTDVTPVTKDELKTILKKNGWRFNWKNEFKLPDRSVYKLVIENNPGIQGLVCLQIMTNYIELHLIETAPHNFGKDKKYLGVAGNLVAFACKTSFDIGFEGYVSFIAKTSLIQHYIDTLGATLIFKNRMNISSYSAKKLVNSYYKNHI